MIRPLLLHLATLAGMLFEESNLCNLNCNFSETFDCIERSNNVFVAQDLFCALV